MVKMGLSAEAPKVSQCCWSQRLFRKKMSIREVKIVFLGSSGVGKTSLVRSFVTKQFTPNVDTTIGASYLTKVMRVDGVGKTEEYEGVTQIVKVSLSQLTGLVNLKVLLGGNFEDSNLLNLPYIEISSDPKAPHAHVSQFNVWDTAGQEKYESLTSMYYRNTDAAVLVYDVMDSQSFKKLKHWANVLKNNLDRKVALIAVGNKVDLLNGDDGNRAVEAEEVNEVVASIGASYVETSAKDNIEVDEAFKRIVHLLPPLEADNSDEDQIKLQLGGSGSGNGAGCC